MAKFQIVSAVLVLMLAVVHVACAARDVNSIAAPAHAPAPGPAVPPTHDVPKVAAPGAMFTVALSTVTKDKFQVGMPLYRDRRHPAMLIPAFKVESYNQQQTGGV